MIASCELKIVDGRRISSIMNFGYIDVGDGMCWWQLQDVVDILILVTNINYLFALALVTNIQTMSSRSKFRHQRQKIVKL